MLEEEDCWAIGLHGASSITQHSRREHARGERAAGCPLVCHLNIQSPFICNMGIIISAPSPSKSCGVDKLLDKRTLCKL